MTKRIGEMTPQHYARICGVLYLYIIVAAIFADVFVRSQLIVPADPSEFLFRIGLTGELLHLACDVAVAMLLYALLRPVDRNIALPAAFMRLACLIILGVASLGHLATLRLLSGAEYLTNFRPDQLHTLALLVMKLHGDAYAISLVFFGFACLSLGYLLCRPGYLPRTIGVPLAIAGACYLVQTLSQFLNPAFAATLFPAIFVPAFIAELSLALWLTIKGVDTAKCEARAGALAS